MFLKNCWYVVAWYHEITTETLTACRILNEDVVLYRKQDGNAVAMIDRCSHRLAPLSKGRLEGDRLRCMYHGLLFDAGGQCVEILQQQRIPPTLNVRTFPVVERDRFVWIWMGDPALADPANIPDAHWQDDPAWRSLPGYVHYDFADYRLIMDNLLDFSHLSFVHEKTLGGGTGSAEVRPKIQRFDWGLRISRRYFNDVVPPFLKNVAKFDGPADRWQVYEWRIAGNILSMDSGVAPAGMSASEDNLPPHACAFHAIQALTPESDTSTHYFWSHGHNFELDKPEVTREVADQVAVAFAEDKAMIQAQQAVLQRHPDAVMENIAADAALLQARWLLDKMLDDERAMSSPAQADPRRLHTQSLSGE